MIITATELQNNFGKYIQLMHTETILFTKNGKVVGKLLPVRGDKNEALERLEQLKLGLHDVEEDEVMRGKAEKYHG